MAYRDKAKRDACLKRYREKPENKVKQARRMRHWFLMKRYSISIDQFDEMLKRQLYACAICGSGDSGNGMDWSVDHCHATGKVRGILCTGCNTGLGGFKDNVKIMKSAIKYLKGV